MRSKLQYIYSISVLIGVLVTSYLMMNRSSLDHGQAMRAIAPTFRMEAQTMDPALSQLLEMENVLRKLREEKTEKDKRLPADTDESPAFR